MKRLGFLAALAVSGSAFGFSFDISGGTGGSIPDGPSPGNLPGTPFVATLNVSGTGATIDTFDFAGVNGFNHTWIGDLVVTVSHNGVTVDLMDRNYRLLNTESGLSGDLNGDYLFNNTDSSVTGNFVLGMNAGGTYSRYSNAGAGSSSATNNFNDFVGMALDGDWVFTFTDHWNFDTGGLQSVRIVGTASAVPEPATLAALGIGAAALLRRRRK